MNASRKILPHKTWLLVSLFIVSLTLSLHSADTCEGRVVNAAGEGVRGVQISLLKNQLTTETDSTGHFMFDFSIVANETPVFSVTPESPGALFLKNKLLFPKGGKLYTPDGKLFQHTMLPAQNSPNSPPLLFAKKTEGDPVSPDTLKLSTFGYVMRHEVDPGQAQLGDFFLYDTRGMDPAEYEKLFCFEVLYIYAYFRDNVPTSAETAPEPKTMYKNIDDPYTVYYDFKSSYNIRNSFSNTHTGIGVTLDSTAKGFIITSVVPGSPAADAKLKKGDIFTTVNSVSVVGLNWKDFRALIMGEPGDSKTLGLDRDGVTINVDIILRSFVYPSVYHSYTEEDSLPLIKMTGFYKSTINGGGTAKEMRNALENYSQDDYVIIDMRGNGGGEINECVNVISEYVPTGTQVAKFTRWDYNFSEDAGKHKDTIYTTNSEGNSLSKKIYVLMDKYSASSSEIFISCLMDNRPDIVCIGEKSYGKARGQVVLLTPMGGIARVTFSTITPLKSPAYDMMGIEPHIAIQPSQDAYEVAVEHIQNAQSSILSKKSGHRKRNSKYYHRTLADLSTKEPWLLMK
ncbi:MAG: PDZ domain-containing protein [Fibrobacteria bacterium]|nr:PDZ domain-containing protein [Fibrobacteria bacterium]